mgnify:CR=1 FL=1
MKLLLAGTIPRDTIDLITGEARIAGGRLYIGDCEVSLMRGTAAMVGAACAVAAFWGDPCPQTVIGGDIGTQTGSRNIYRYLIKNLPAQDVAVLGLHYIIPDIALHNQVCAAVQKMKRRPVLIADAGFMYVAKASGRAPFYDLFLPDLGELAFLADDRAMHPAYTRGFLTTLEEAPEQLLKRAFSTGNAARSVCVKGDIDRVCVGGHIIETIAHPIIEALEPIGGTGDTITGLAAALAAHGCTIVAACRIACTVNRIAGQMAKATPATQISELISHIPAALEEVLKGTAAAP